MAGSSMKDIKLRIKSIQGTRQITKAMQLVASSKLRRAKDRMEQAAPYSDSFKEIIKKLSQSADASDSVFFRQREAKNVCHCVIAGDRGLAGGYNSNVFRLVVNQIEDSGANVKIIPIGRKTTEFFKKKYELEDEAYSTVSEVSIGDCFRLGAQLAEKYASGEFDEVYITYTHYKNALHQEPVCEKVFPLAVEGEGKRVQIECEGGFAGMLRQSIPSYVASRVYSAVAQSYVCELTARQNAMDTATGNADDMLSELQLQYNRARQAGITQEITEIVAGANS